MTCRGVATLGTVDDLGIIYEDSDAAQQIAQLMDEIAVKLRTVT